MKILVTGGPVHAKIDAVKFVTNRFKGGLMAALANKLYYVGDNIEVVYLCSKESEMSLEASMYNASERKITATITTVHHDGFHDYRQKVMEMAPNYDAVVLGAAVANLLPVSYADFTNSEDMGILGRKPEWVDMPLKGKFPSHDYKPGDKFQMTWQIAPRIIDEVKAHMKPGAHLFGFKLLSGVSKAELVTAAYDIVLGAKATMVFANDATNLNICHCVGKDRSSRRTKRDNLADEIIALTNDEYYQTNVIVDSDKVIDCLKPRVSSLFDTTRLSKSPEGIMYGTAACKYEQGFLTTKRGKKQSDEIVFVKSVDHDHHMVRTIGGKATLNAPLLDWIFKMQPEVSRIVHYHDMQDGEPVYAWAPPGTVRDSQRDAHGSFNIDNHGCILLYDKNGNLL